jgi:hypothetical protein
MQEVWLPVVGFEGLYEVSDQGRVKSLARRDATGLRRIAERILKPYLNIHGYWQVRLHKEGRSKNFRVHVLVAAAFLGPKPEGLVICHGPGRKQDNRPCNLSYKTQSENCLDKHRDGTAQIGERSSKTSLTEAQVRYVRRELVNAPLGTALRLSRELGVSHSTIYRLKNKHTWGWLI